MNFNALIAVLEIKGIISREEGEKLVEHFNNKPQSTQLADAVEQITEILQPATHILDSVSKQVKTIAKDEAKKVATKVAHEVAEIDTAVSTQVKKVTDHAKKK